MREAKTSITHAAPIMALALGEENSDQEGTSQDLGLQCHTSQRHRAQLSQRQRYSSEVTLTAALLGISKERAAEALKAMKHKKVEH